MTKQLTPKIFLRMYKYKLLGKPTTKSKNIQNMRLLASTGPTRVLMGTEQDTGQVKYRVSDPLDDVIKYYSSVAIFYKMFEDTKTWDEVQIWDDVGRLSVLTKRQYKDLKNAN